MNSSTYAIWYDRFIAYLIDSFLLLVPTLLLIGMVGSVNAAGEPVVPPSFAPLAFLLQAAYFIAFFSGSWQATPGMRLMAIHLTRVGGGKLHQREGLERFLALIIPSLPLQASFLSQQFSTSLFVFLHVLWFMPVITTRVGLHDRMTETRVVTGRIA